MVESSNFLCCHSVPDTEPRQNTHLAKHVKVTTLNFKLVWIPACAGMTEFRFSPCLCDEVFS